MADIFIGRQAIFNRKMEVIAYELLYRSCDTNSASFSDPDLATTQVTLNTIIEVGLNKIVNKSKAFINLTRNFIVGNYPILLPPNRMVIEIPENIETDQELLTALRELHKAGYSIALDDVVDLERVISYQNIVSIVKLDLKQIDPQALPGLIRSVKDHGFLVLAEKVETMEEFKLCHNLGVDYFQGYFLCRPNIIHGQKMDSSRLVIMRSIAMIQNQKTTFSDLEQIIAQDLSLCFKLLRLTNSGYYSFISEVKSIRQAISLIGLDTVRGWLSLLLMTQLNDKPLELTNIAL
ncbi:MAG: EAL and HDOD domain-containing protein, partial [Anaerolineaceae bacterium]